MIKRHSMLFVLFCFSTSDITETNAYQKKKKRERDRYFNKLLSNLPGMVTRYFTRKQRRTSSCLFNINVNINSAFHICIQQKQAPGESRITFKINTCEASEGRDGKLNGMVIYFFGLIFFSHASVLLHPLKNSWERFAIRDLNSEQVI